MNNNLKMKVIVIINDSNKFEEEINKFVVENKISVVATQTNLSTCANGATVTTTYMATLFYRVL